MFDRSCSRYNLCKWCSMSAKQAANLTHFDQFTQIWIELLLWNAVAFEWWERDNCGPEVNLANLLALVKVFPPGGEARQVKASQGKATVTVECVNSCSCKKKKKKKKIGHGQISPNNNSATATRNGQLNLQHFRFVASTIYAIFCFVFFFFLFYTCCCYCCCIFSLAFFFFFYFIFFFDFVAFLKHFHFRFQFVCFEVSRCHRAGANNHNNRGKRAVSQPASQSASQPARLTRPERSASKQTG